MEAPHMSPRHYVILNHLSNLPEKILSQHHVNNISEFVLHDLAQKQCFNLKKAAFFVNNPDFDCCKGIAGYSQSEPYEHHSSSWDNPTSFSTFMKDSPFNQRVRRINRRKMIDHASETAHVARELDFSQYRSLVFPLKHDNTGILIFEQEPHEANTEIDTLMQRGACLLGFCPVF